KALEALGISIVGRHHATARKEDGGSGWDADCGATLESRHAVDSGPEPADSLGPIEAQCHGPRIPGGGCRLSCVVGGQYSSWVAVERGQDDDPLTSLRKADSAGVDDSVGPPVTQPRKPRHDSVQGSSLRELQHEWHVLPEDPRDRPRFEQAKHFADQSRVRPLDSGRLTRLAEILAGKATDQEVDGRPGSRSRGRGHGPARRQLSKVDPDYPRSRPDGARHLPCSTRPRQPTRPRPE